MPHPGRELFTIAAFQQTPVLIFGHPHGEHFAAFCLPDPASTTLDGRQIFSAGAVLVKAAGASVVFSGLAQPWKPVT